MFNPCPHGHGAKCFASRGLPCEVGNSLSVTLYDMTSTATLTEERVVWLWIKMSNFCAWVCHDIYCGYLGIMYKCIYIYTQKIMKDMAMQMENFCYHDVASVYPNIHPTSGWNDEKSESFHISKDDLWVTQPSHCLVHFWVKELSSSMVSNMDKAPNKQNLDTATR